MQKSSKLRLDYSFIILVFILITCFFSYMGFKANEIRKNSIATILTTNANLVENNFTNIIDFTQEKLSLTSEFISLPENKGNLDEIYKILKKFENDNKIKDILSWNNIGYLNQDFVLQVSSTQGILEKPFDVSNRDFIKICKQNPGKLFIWDPSTGFMHDSLVITGGIGIADEQNNFLGMLAIDFNIEEMAKKFDNIINNQDVSFAILDPESLQILFESKNLLTSKNDLADMLSEIKLGDPYLKISSYNTESSFIAYKLKNYPFVIYVGSKPYKNAAQQIARKLFEDLPEVAIAFTIMLVIILFFRYYILTPFLRLSEIASNISKGEELAHIPNARSIHESNLLNALLSISEYIKNEMRLKSELAKANSDIIDNNKKLSRMVQERTIELENALEAKVRFLNNMSHEIKTPIHGINSLSESLLANWHRLDEEKKLKIVETIKGSGFRITKLITNLLDLNALDKNEAEFNFEVYDIAEVVNQAIANMSKLTKEKDLEVLVSIAEDSETKTMMDRNKITQVIENIVDNSVKFSQKGIIWVYIANGIITYDDQTQANSIWVSIADEGIGVPEEELGLIFDKFAESSRTRSQAGGTGLGLTLCRELVLAHNGMIEASNSQMGGLVVSFAIPIILP